MTVAWRGASRAIAIAAACAAAAACGSSRKNTESGGTNTGPTTAAPPSELNFKIQSAELAAPDARPSITFKATDAKGNPVDVIAAVTATAAQGGWVPHFTLSQLEPATAASGPTYTSLYERPAAGRQYVVGGQTIDPAVPTGAIQPVSDAPPAGAAPANLVAVDAAQGVYKYTFATPPSATVQPKIDRNKSFLAGIYGRRTVNGVVYPAADTFAFVPATGAAGQRFVSVDESACNRCHNPVLQAHDQRVTVQLCLTCHAGDQGTTYRDPESGNDIDFQSMIHRIHLGSSANPTMLPFRIVGFSTVAAPAPLPESSVSDWSDVAFPPDVRNCRICHAATTGAPQSAAFANAVPKACLSCHAYVKFDGSAPITCAFNTTETTACNHPLGVAANVNCASCHAAGTGLGADRVHVPPSAVAQAFKYELVNATVGQDRKVTVQFRVVNPQAANQPYDIFADAPFTDLASGNSSLNVKFGWPTDEYTNEGSNQNYGQPDSVNALSGATKATPVAGQPGVFQVVSNVPVPSGVNGVTVDIEGHPSVNGERVPVTSLVQNVGVGGAAAPARRQVVTAEACNACHVQLSAHGANRNGTPAVCVVCHNPEATDKGRRTSGVTGEQSIDFKVLIHAIHAGEIRTTPYDVYGFGNTLNEFPAPYPGAAGNCALCHQGTSYQLPLQAGVHDTTISTGADPKAITDNVRMPAAVAVCTSCHDYVKFDGTGTGDCVQGKQETADCNHPGGIVQTDPQFGKNCATCHMPGGLVPVDQVHPIRTTSASTGTGSTAPSH